MLMLLAGGVGLAGGLMPNPFFGLSEARADRPLRIVAFGDSLTAGYMLPAKDAFPTQLEAALRKAGLKVEVANAGVSGDTTAGGLARLDWSIPDGTDAVIVELGANDALRGLDPARARANLDAIVSRLRERGMAVMLAGMMAPRNLGADYVRAFDSIYPDLSKKYGVPLYPFFLDGVVGNPTLHIGDGLHPSAAGVAEIVKRIQPSVEAFLATVKPTG
jgi:acyl-CoA thioesterase-1